MDIERVPPGSVVVLIHGDNYGKPKLPGRYLTLSADSPEALKDIPRVTKWVVVDTFAPLTIWSPALSGAEEAELNSKGTLELDLSSIKPKAEEPICDPNDAFYAPFTHITSMIRPGPRIRIWRLAKP